MFYTREQIAKLEKYRKTFETAVNSGFARNVGSIALKEIEEIYDEAYKSHYTYNNSCSICVLTFLKRVGEPFLKESKQYAEEDAQKAQQVVEETPVQIEKPKRTRKKKEETKDGTE